MRTHGIVYCVTNVVTGKKYVGITVCGLRRRWLAHQRSAAKGSLSHLHCSIRVYGSLKFRVKIIANNVPREQLAHYEAGFIVSLGARAPQGYNLTDGGDGTVNVDASVRARIGEKLRGRKQTPEVRAKISRAQRGSHRTDETKARISAAHLGKKLTEDHRAKLSAAKLGRRLAPRSADHSRKISEGLVAAHARRKARG